MVESISKSSTGILTDLTSKAAMKVLHVDDDLNCLKIAEQCLKMQGRFQVDTARSVEEAMEMMEKETYDAIISDYQMPGKDGLEFLKELRANGNNIPFIVFTGKGREEIAVKALNLGADGYIDKHGDPETVYCELAHSIRTASGSKRAEEAKRRSEQHYRSLLESISDSVCVLDREWRHVIVNEATARFTKIPKEKLLGNKLTDLFPGVEKTPFLAAFKRVMETRKPEIASGKYVFEDGQEGWCEVHVYPVPEGILCISSDITERKKAEMRLRANALILENIADSVIVTDLEGRITSWNEGASKIFGFSAKEMLGENIAKVSKPKEREQVAPAQLEQVRKGVLFSGEWEGVRRDGEPVRLMLTTKLLKNSQGEAVGMIGVGKDITERKKAEEALRGSEEKWRSLAENAPNIIVIVDRVGTIEFINRTVVNARPEEIVGKSIYDFIDAEHHNMVKKTIEQVFQTGEGGRYEISGVGPKGSVAWYATHVGPIKHDGQVAYVTLITTDFTERKKGEHALLESQQKFERLFKGIPEATAVVDVNDCVLDLNPRFRQLFGYSVDEARGKPLDDLIVPNDKKREAKMLTENSKEGYVLFETVRKAKDGSLVPVSISAAPISVEGQHVGDIVLYYNITGRKQTEETLRKSEKKYRSLFEDSSDGLVLVDRDDGSILDCNPEFMRQTGRNKEQLLKMKIWDIRPSHLREAAKKEFFEVKQKGFGGSMELAFQKPSGETVLVDFLSKTAKVGDREVLQSRCRDITERRKAEQALKESEEKYRRLVELAPDGMVAVNAEGIVTSANRSFLKLVGYDSEEGIVGKPFTELVTIQGEDIPRFQEMFSSLMNGEPLSPVEFLYVRKDGTSRWAEVHPGLLIKDGKPAGAQVIMRDVSERKNAEKLIQENQQKFEQLFMSNPEAAVYVDPNERVLNVSPRFTELFGYSFDEVKGKFLDDFVVPDDRKKEALMLTQKGKEGYVYYETVRKNKKGSLIPVTLSTAPIMLQGQHVGGIVLYKDTTERRNMTESLENSEKRLRILFESAPDGYYLSDLSGTLVDGNKAAEKITGYAKTELIGKSFSKLLPRSQILKAAKLLGLNAAGKSTGPDEFVLNRKDGTQVTVEIRTHPVRIEDQRLVLGIARDITERKRGERLILENQQKFEHLFRGNPEATVFLDSSFHVLDIGPRFTSLFGYTLDEIRGKHINDVVATTNMMEEARMLDEKAAKGYVYHDAVRMRKDGSLIPVSISAAPILIQGQLAGYIGVYKDVSQLKKAEGELRRAMEGLQVMNEKLRVVGGLTRHDVNNKLTAVAGYTYLARNKLPGNSEVLDYLKQIEASIEQTVKIFGFAKTYEMLGVEELAYVDVEKTVDEAVSLFPSLKDIKVVNDCHGLTVLADSLLRQLFYNLVDNSLKYGEKLSRIRVSYEDKNDHLNVIYEDDGVGIPHAAKPKLFDEGYTTGKGSGYGLFLVKRMMEVYGWTIQETGIQGKGARFILTVPEKSQQGKPLYKLP